MRVPGKLGPDLPVPYDGWTEEEWDRVSDEDEDENKCVPCAAYGVTKKDLKAAAVSTEHLLRHARANK